MLDRNQPNLICATCDPNTNRASSRQPRTQQASHWAEDDGMAFLLVCAIKALGYRDNRRTNLDDLAILTGGEVFTDDRGLTLDKVQPEMLGTAKKITVSIDDTIILHGGGDKKLIEDRCEKLRTAMEKSSGTFDKEKAQVGLSKLFGGVAVFKVGGASEVEVGERKDRVTNALNATRAVVEEGIVPGGGVALLYATKILENLQTQNGDEKRGVQIIQNALKLSDASSEPTTPLDARRSSGDSSTNHQQHI